MGKQKETCGELGDAPNEKYRQFFEKFSEIETLDVSQWKVLHLLAYFTKRYQDIYGVKYQFKFNSPSPAKCFEVFQIKKLAQMLSSNPKILRDYIDWAFNEKTKSNKRRPTSISFITQEQIVNFYKINVLLADKKELHIDRSTPLAEDVKAIFSACGLFNTYGDIAFFFNAIRSGGMDQSFVEKFDTAMKDAAHAGFDPDILMRII